MTSINIFSALDKGIIFIHSDEGWFWRSEEDDPEEYGNGPFLSEQDAALDFISGDDTDLI